MRVPALLSSAIVVVTALVLQGCAGGVAWSEATAVELATGRQTSREEAAYSGQMAALVAHNQLLRLDRANGVAGEGRTETLGSATAAARRILAALDAGRAAEPIAPVVAEPGKDRFSFGARWRTAHQTLYLAPSSTQSGSAPFAFSGLQARRSDILVSAIDDRAFRLTLSCDGALAVSAAGGRRTLAPGEQAVFAGGDARPLVLTPSEGLSRCEALARFDDGERRLSIVRQETASPDLAELDVRVDACAAPVAGSRLEKVFYEARWLSQSCTFGADPELLPGEVEGFNAKVAALLGRPLSEAFLDAGDPEAPLDFSRAPKLTLVYVSYLDIKADFSGRVIDRLLRHHAARGATIRVMASDVLERDKDRAMLERLAADHLNVEYKAFQWTPPPGRTMEEALSRFHKVHHAKVLAVLSSQPGRSVAILGGRNIHDGFLFAKPVDLSGYPELQQYDRVRGMTLNYYSNWRDLDVALRGDAAVRTLAAHFSTLWHADAQTGLARPLSLGVGGTPARGGTIRHFLSIPYADGRALERYYVDLIDAAEHTIEIVNPYLNMTPAIEAAIDREVKITIVGRIDLSGDLGGATMTAVNRLFVERHASRVSIYDYRDTKMLLHAKMFMIDGRLSIMSSVNFNNRSFIHDSENGIAVLDPGFYRRVKTVFEAYRKASVRADGAAKLSPGWRLLLSNRTLLEAL